MQMTQSRFLDAAFATKLAARQATLPAERSKWRKINSAVHSITIEHAAPGSIHLGYQMIGEDPNVYVLVTFRSPEGIVRSFHVPYRQLSGQAQLIVVKTLGNPYTFKANLDATRELEGARRWSRMP